MVSEAGADDKYLGSVMKRVTKTIARGMVRSEEEATVMDLACVGSDAENLDQFAEWMEEEQIDFIRDTARRLADADHDLDPLAGRFDEWLHNPKIRNLITARDPSFSIQDLVDENKVLVVRFGEGASDSEKRLASLPLIARSAAAKKISDNEDPFYVIADEFDSIATEQSSIHNILSEAGAFHYRLTMACQAPSNQLPGVIKRAIENQCETFITFNPRGQKDAKFVAEKHTVDKSDVSGISKYRMYMRSHDENDDFTDSYLVDAFRPIDEVREEVIGEPARTDEEVEALKRRSMERYGDEIESAAEQQRQSLFHPDPDKRAIEGTETAETKQHAQALKAAFIESVRQGTPGEILIADTLDRLNDTLDTDYTDPDSAWREVYQPIPDTQIDYQETDDEDKIEILDRAWASVGTDKSSGGKGHLDLMKHAEVPLTQLGFVLDILDQGDGAANDSMPDAIARLDDVLDTGDLDPKRDRAEIAKRVDAFRQSEEHAVVHRLAGSRDAYIEAESSTTKTQPSQAVMNAIQAHNAGHRCLFLIRPGLARKLNGYLAHGPFGCNSGKSTEEETRFYTRSGTPLNIDGEDMTRPGKKDNVWVREKKSGQIVLKDKSGTEHARFDSPAEVFNNADAYPDDGDRNIMEPVIPAFELDGDSMEEVEWDIIVVPQPKDVDHEYDPDDETDEPRMLTPLDLELFREREENVKLIDLPLNDSHDDQEPSTTVTTMNQTDKDALVDAIEDTKFRNNDD